jgi:quinoprotein glucose dehydrogenase
MSLTKIPGMSTWQLRGFQSALGTAVAALMISSCQSPAPIRYDGPIAEWSQWGGSEGGVRFSPLTQIAPENVDRLQVAWTYHMGGPPKDRKAGWFVEVTPIVAEGRMYLCTPLNRVVALDPQTGRELWSFDPVIDRQQVTTHFNCRGVTFHRNKRTTPGAACAARILTGTLDGRLIALDAITGARCKGFGVGGTVNLMASLGDVRAGEYNVTSPPVVVANQVVIGGHVKDFARVDVPAGVVRAFDLHTGALTWAWNPLPPGSLDSRLAPPGETYARRTPNAWSMFSVDRERGLVFIPTGNPADDLYGGAREGIDYYGSSVVALEASTGRVVWHFQTVHHDLWDYDVASQPLLIDFPTDHGRVPAVVQGTKQGNIYVLNRETGTPLVPVEERPVSQVGALPGETPSLTQPFPTNPAYVFYAGALTEETVWGFTPWDKAKCREQLHGVLHEGIYTLRSLRGSLIEPSSSGIMSWGGLAVDSSRDILIVNTTHIAAIQRAIPSKEAEAQYNQGNPLRRMEGSPYTVSGAPFLSPFGAPCNPPPWGALTAIDLKAGKRLWEVPLGSTRDRAPFPFWFDKGVPSVGGPIVTASGLTFIAATTDNFVRAFDTKTGAKLWEERLPAGGQAVPMTYRLRADSKQYMVIAAGGHEYLGTKLGDSVIAYALND